MLTGPGDGRKVVCTPRKAWDLGKVTSGSETDAFLLPEFQQEIMEDEDWIPCPDSLSTRERVNFP